MSFNSMLIFFSFFLYWPLLLSLAGEMLPTTCQSLRRVHRVKELSYSWLFFLNYLHVIKPKTAQKNFERRNSFFLFLFFYSRKSCLLARCWFVNSRSNEKSPPHPAIFFLFCRTCERQLTLLNICACFFCFFF